jgi:hypothetical protein
MDSKERQLPPDVRFVAASVAMDYQMAFGSVADRHGRGHVAPTLPMARNRTADYRLVVTDLAAQDGHNLD